MNTAITETNFKFPGQTGMYKGKVRDVYTIKNDILVSIATDRISAFDVILPSAIPYKGQVLNQLAEYFLNATSDIAPNWLLAVPDPNVSIGRKCQPFAIEMVIRGYLVGHAWREYKAGKRQLCGIQLPEGMREYDAFPEPIITPTTKAHEGHDEDISEGEIIKKGLASTEEFRQLSDLTRKLFNRGQAMAKERGLTLVDTKYEFGRHNNQIYVIDEIHTPDSSRYFYQASYDAFMRDRKTEAPKHLSKEFVRQWLLEQGFSGQDNQPPPDMTDEFVDSVSNRYIELYEQLTGNSFAPDKRANRMAHLEESINKSLKEVT